MKTASDRGIALVIVLWGMTALALIAGSLAKSLRVEATVAGNEVAVAKARALADAGAHRGIAALFDDDEETRWQTDGAVYDVPYRGTTLAVSVAAETGRIDLNGADDELIKSLLRSAGLDFSDADALGDAILDWRDEDELVRLNGAEADAYEEAGLPYGPRNNFFASIDELQQVLGMTPALFAELAPAITIYSGLNGINPEVAPRAALLALPGVNPAEVEALLAVREQNQYTFPKLALPGLTGVSEWLVTEPSIVFTVRAEARSGDAAFAREAVVWTPDDDGEKPYWVLDWREGRIGPASTPDDDGATDE